MEGRYRILGTLGEGGVGVVYKAHDTLLDKTVAIKKIQSRSNATDVIRFQKEAKVAGALVHPNILGVIDFGLSKDNSFYLVLNFIEGESLSGLLKRTGALPLFEALNIFIQIARGLAHAHEHKVIHRDIKPSNIMLVDDGAGSTKALIVDFGLAKTLEEDQNLTKSGVGIGTPRYMSPEQIRADREIGPATDVYSMGCLMFETLAGQPAFHGDNVMQTLQMHLNDEIPDLNSVGDVQFPGGIVEIITKCLQKDARARYASGKELLAQLAEFLEHLQSSSGEPIDASKLSPKAGATAGNGSRESNASKNMTLGSRLTAFLRQKYLMLGAVLISTIVLFEFAVPIISSIVKPDSAPVRISPVGALVRFGANDNRHFERSLGNHLKNKGSRKVTELGEALSAAGETPNSGADGDHSTEMLAGFPDLDARDSKIVKQATRMIETGPDSAPNHSATGIPVLVVDEHFESGSGPRTTVSRSSNRVNRISIDEEAPIPLAGFHDGQFRYSTSGKFWSVNTKDEHVRELVGKHGREVQRIQFRRATVTGAGYALLESCPLTFLEFESTQITPEVLRAIGNLSSVMTVAFKRCPEIDFGHLNELNRLEQFHELIIEGSALTKSDMENIAKIQSVDQLKLDNCKGLTRDNLLPILKLPRLGALHMVSTDFDDKGFDVLKKLHLSNLVLTDTRITKAGLSSYLKAVGKTPMYIEVSLNDSITLSELLKLRAIYPKFALNAVEPKLDTDFVFHLD